MSGEAYIHSRCHLKSPTWAVVLPDNRLRIECAECKKEIVIFELSDGLDEAARPNQDV